MNQTNRIFIIGHSGAGKGLLVILMRLEQLTIRRLILK